MTAHTSPNPVFNAAANVAEATRQVAVATAAGTGAVLQMNVRLAEIAYYRAVYAATRSTTISSASDSMALQALGVNP